MGDDGFFTFLARHGSLGDFAQGEQQRSDIEALHDRADAAQAAHAGDIGGLSQRVTVLTRELAAMKVAFEVLSRVLVETAGVDPAALDARLREALASTPAANGPVVCSNCGMSFLAAQTVVTTSGTYCRRCRGFAAG